MRKLQLERRQKIISSIILSLLLLTAGFTFLPARAGTTYNVSTVAELQNAVNLVNAGSGGDVIVLAPGVYVTSTLFIFRDVTIQGDASSNTTLDGNGGIILETFSASISVQNLTFQNASDAIISDSPGVFTANGVTITQNTFGFEGGDSGGSSFFTNSTIANNNTGIRVDCASMTLTNVTVSDNQTGLDFSSCGEQMTLTNSLVVRNGQDCSGSGITPVGDASIDSDGSCVLMGFGSVSTESVSSIVLGPLANNGGPTLTESISGSSVAIGAGDTTACPPKDQTGFSRTFRCDVGAFEARVASLPLVKSQCMNGGWRNYDRFKNQGDCIQFVNTGK